MKQLEKVDCSRGAPMGRDSYGSVQTCGPRSVRVFKVVLQDGYDDGGAYWGSGQGVLPLYCALSEEYGFRAFVRAPNRNKAIEELRIEHKYLKAVPHVSRK